MDAIFLPAPADISIPEDTKGGAITGGSQVLAEDSLAEPAAAYLRALVATTFAAPSTQGSNVAANITFTRDASLEPTHVLVKADDRGITVSAVDLAGFWRGAQIVIQMLGPDVMTGLPSSLEQLPYLPLEIHDFPSNSNRRMTLPLLHLAQDLEDAKALVAQLAAVGVNQLVLFPPESKPGELLPLPHGLDLDDYEDLLTHAETLGVAMLPDFSGITVGDLAETALAPYPRPAIEQSLWPNAAAELNRAWVGERAAKITNPNGLDLDTNQRIAKYALTWAAQGIGFTEWNQSEWIWHLARLAPQPAKTTGQTLVALLLAPGTHAHGDHVEMRRGLEGIIGGGLKITAMVNGEPVPVTLTPGHPLADHPTAGVYQVTIPTLKEDDDLRLAAIAKTDDGCSC